MIYLNKGNNFAALELLKQARDIHLNLGVKNMGLQAIEEMIKQINVINDRP